jgi:hypothetical protein
VVAVDPATAAQWLSRRSSPVHEDLVSRYAEIMAAQRWRHDGATLPIVFTDDGSRLIDGCHRLSAVVKSGLTITFNVAFL